MTAMDKFLDLGRAFALDAEDLLRSRTRSGLVHSTGDIRASGDEVEVKVREYLRRVLPPRFYVTSGHLIDAQHRVSSQHDIIIADSFNLPSLYTARDGTEYVPATSVYAIGEVKSSYRKAGGYFQKIAEDLAKVAAMDRPLIENSMVDGKITDSTTLWDMAQPISKDQYLNHLFVFLLCVDVGDFAFQDIIPHLDTALPNLVPNVTVFLNKGVMVRMRLNMTGEGKYHKYPIEAPSPEYDWVFAESMDNDSGGTREGSNLAFLYGVLVDHLSNSRLEPTDAYQYTSNLVYLRRSTLKWSKGYPPEYTT